MWTGGSQSKLTDAWRLLRNTDFWVSLPERLFNMGESTEILLKDPSDHDAQSDLGTIGKDKGERVPQM